MTKILWADDQINVAKSFASALLEAGAEIDFVESGEAALHAIRCSSYDLVLLDLSMPPGRWGGLWLLAQLKELQYSGAIIVVSGEGGQSETIQALRLGAVDYVTKEQLSIELPSQIAKVLKKSDPIKDLIRIISGGESEVVEFKSTLRKNLRSDKFDPDIELSVLKSIAGFMNANGGSLLIGVGDNGDIIGIKHDNFKDPDRFEIHFRNLVREAIGAEFTASVFTTMSIVDGENVFLIKCQSSKQPVYVRWKAPGEPRYQDLFFVRAGPQTEQLGTKQAVAYISSHFL